MMQIEEGMKKIMENSVAMMKVSTVNMNALVSRLERIHNEKNVVDLENEVGASSLKMTPCTTRRTRQSTKLVEESLPQDLLDLKEATKAMFLLEKEASQALDIFK